MSDKAYASFLSSRCSLSYGEWLAAGCPSYEEQGPVVDARCSATVSLLETLPSRDEALHTSGLAKAAPVTPVRADEVP